jgi:hypothetical protein
MPLKTRNHWIHDTFDAYQRMKAYAGQDDGMGAESAWLFSECRSLF